MAKFQIRYPNGEVQEIEAELIYYTPEVVTLVAGPEGDRRTVFLAQIVSGITVSEVPA